MTSQASQSSATRRRFLQVGLLGAGLAGVAVVSSRWRHRSVFTQGAQKNPYAYDLDRYESVNASWLHYEEEERLRPERKDPRKLALGPEDQVYLASENYVCLLESDGRCGMEIALSGTARCLAVARDKSVFVGLRDHVEVFDAKGQRKAAWDAPSGKPWLTSLALGKEEGEVFAADAGNRIIHRYDRSGKLLGQIGAKDTSRNIPGLIVPSPYLDVIWHTDGLLRVNNPGRHRVELYTPEGDLELAWGKPSAALEGFCGCCNPISLAVLADGHCVTCEKGLARVKVYTPQGELESVVAAPESFATPAEPSLDHTGDTAELGLDAVADSRGRIHILDLAAGDIRIMRRIS